MHDLLSFEISDCFSNKFKELAKRGGDIRRMFLLGQKLIQDNPSIDLIDLSLGNPDLEPPHEVKQALLNLVQSNEIGAHRYMDSAGLIEVRKFLAKELSRSEQIDVSENSVYLSVGAAGGLQILLRTFLNPEDEVILFAPFFPEYVPYIENFYGKPVSVACGENHEPNLADLKSKITKKTKAIILNTPNNPAGVSYSEKTLIHITLLLQELKESNGQIVQLISDEPYNRVVFNQNEITRVLKLYEHSWIVRSFSKDLGLAGERIGFIAWRKELAHFEVINAFRNASRILGFVSAPRLMQRLLPLVYHARVDVDVYKKRVDAFIRILKEVNIESVHPSAGFFVFPKCPFEDDFKFCEDLISCGVLCVPGRGFGCPGYFRASLTQPQERIEEAAHRIVAFVKG